MKILKIALISCLLLIAAQSVAFAGSGKAIVSHWYAYGTGTGSHVYHLWISNISKSDLVVKVTFYNKDGSIYTNNVTPGNFQNNNTEIASGKTAQVVVRGLSYGNDGVYGYAVIEWENKGDDDDAVGLVAWADMQVHDTSGKGHSIMINQGDPF